MASMRPLRWKSRYQTRDAEIDRRNRAFVDCLNSLIITAGQCEHCQEMEDFMGQFITRAEEALLTRPTDRDLGSEFGRYLLESLPLNSNAGTACRQCGLCDLAQEKIAKHLEAPARCLFKST